MRDFGADSRIEPAGRLKNPTPTTPSTHPSSKSSPGSRRVEMDAIQAACSRRAANQKDLVSCRSLIIAGSWCSGAESLFSFLSCRSKSGSSNKNIDDDRRPRSAVPAVNSRHRRRAGVKVYRNSSRQAANRMRMAYESRQRHTTPSAPPCMIQQNPPRDKICIPARRVFLRRSEKADVRQFRLYLSAIFSQDGASRSGFSRSSENTIANNRRTTPAQRPTSSSNLGAVPDRRAMFSSPARETAQNGAERRRERTQPWVPTRSCRDTQRAMRVTFLSIICNVLTSRFLLETRKRHNQVVGSRRLFRRRFRRGQLLTSGRTPGHAPLGVQAARQTSRWNVRPGTLKFTRINAMFIIFAPGILMRRSNGMNSRPMSFDTGAFAAAVVLFVSPYAEFCTPRAGRAGHNAEICAAHRQVDPGTPTGQVVTVSGRRKPQRPAQQKSESRRRLK